MKYVVAFVVTVAVLYEYAVRHPLSSSPWPVLVDAVGGAIILTLPLSLLCRALTKKIPGLRARVADLVILFVLIGAYWAISTSIASDPRIVAPVRFWFGLTFTSWATMFLPFVGCVAFIEYLELRRRESRS